MTGIDALLERLHVETAALIVRRMKVGLWLLLVAIALFGVEALRHGVTQLGWVAAVKGVQLATVVTVAVLLRHTVSWQRAVWIALGTITEVCVTTAISGVLHGEVVSTLMVLIVLLMGTATLLPWGRWPQLVTVGVAGLAAFGNAAGVPNGGDLGPGTVALAIAAVTSVYVAHEFERYRLERRLAEEQARVGQARNAAILEASLDCIVTMDAQGVILEFNPAAERTFGYRRDDVVGRPLADVIVPPALREAHRAGLARFVATGEARVVGRRIEIAALRADGSEFPVELAITRIPGEGAPIFTGYLRDLTERDLAREAKASATLVRAGHEMMSLLDTRLILERLCWLATDALRCDFSHALLCAPDADTFTPHAEYGASDELRLALAGLAVNRAQITSLLAHLQREETAQVIGGAAHPHVPAEMAAGTGAAASLHVPLKRNDELVGVLTANYRTRAEPFTEEQHGIVRGLAQIASMALTNASLVEALEHASRIKSEFLSTMSHELRTPLNAILGYAEMVEDDLCDPAGRTDCAGRIRQKGRMLLELVEETLEIGKLESGQEDVRAEPIALAAWWTQVGQGCVADFPCAAEVAFEWDAAPPALTVLSDARKLTVLVRHLVSNALKFTERGRVSATLRVVADTLTIRAADTGIGIDPAHREMIFEMFRQVDGSESRRFGGTGLGLFIVRRFVELLQGTVTVESEPGAGSVFTVTLPLRPYLNGRSGHQG